MTALMLDDELYDRASQAAAARGTTVDRFVGEAIELSLRATAVRQTSRNGLPVMVVGPGTPSIDPAEIRRNLEEDGF